nr:hypothetical protein [Tanacetum cinerariifolium]
VNTPRSDKDILKLMELMFFLMEKGVCDEFGLNAARLSKFLLSGKCDVTRLQSLVDKKRIVLTKEVVREILQFNDAKGVICLPNDEIFASLARMGYEKPSTKLTFYKAFFSTQWKFFIHTILHCLSAKRTSWNEFSSAMASALICLSSVRDVDAEEEAHFLLKVMMFKSMLQRKLLLRRKGVVIRDPEEELHTDTLAETPTVKDKGKGILIEVPKPMKKKDQVEMDTEYAKILQEELDKEHEKAYKQIDWNAALDYVQSKEPQEVVPVYKIKTLAFYAYSLSP